MRLELVTNLLADVFLVFLVGVAVRTVMDCIGVWGEYRAGRRSLPLALAFSPIIATLVTMPVATIAEPHPPQWVAGTVATVILVGLSCGGGVLGAIGLVVSWIGD